MLGKAQIVIIIACFIFGQSFAQVGPGGIGNSSSNILWLRSDAISGLVNGDTVTTWADTSGNANDLSQPTVALKPEYFSDSINGFPIVSFNVANTRLRRNPFNGFATNNITAIYVNRNNGESNDGVLSYASGGGNNDFLFYNSSNIAIYRNSNLSSGIDGNNNAWQIIQGSWGSTGGRVELWKDGSKDYNNTGFVSGSSITTGGSLCLSHEQDSPDGGYASNQHHIGDFTEVIMYNTYIDSTDHIIIANYLSAKYDISLADNDLYDEDDVGNGNYDYEVAGIGRQSATSLNDDAQGSSILRILNPRDLDDDEYMIWGHDNGTQEATETSDVPSPVVARFERVWRVSEVSSSLTAVDVGAVDVRFDLNGLGSVTTSDLRLLVDTDNDGLFDDETPISGATSLGSDVYAFTGVTALSNNLRFTLGTINNSQTTLPIDLVGFDATLQPDGDVRLNWATSSETNNDYYTVERSQNDQDWEELVQVEGGGNSSEILRFSATDYQPYAGTSYYRLKQTDFDGDFKHSKVVSIFINGSVDLQIEIYPNPVNNSLTIKGAASELSEIYVYDARGLDVTLNTRIIEKSESKLVLDLSTLNSGMYLIQTKSVARKVFKK